MHRIRGAAVVLAVAAASLAGSVAAVGSQSRATTIAYRVTLGSILATDYAQVITQSPTTNDVYFAEGAKVLVVRGHVAPTRFVTAPAPVLALCATRTRLFAVTAASVLDYTLPGGVLLGRWALPASVRTLGVTQAGVSLVGDRLWTWVDGETDQSGYEYGSVVVYDTRTWTNRTFFKERVNPTDVAADKDGYFFLANDRVVRVEPSLRVRQSASTRDASDAPVAAGGSYAYLVAIRDDTTYWLDTYQVGAMHRVHSVKVPLYTYGPLVTPSGLLGLRGGTGHTATSVVLIDPATGAEVHEVTVPGAMELLRGTTLSAVAQLHGMMYLDRLG